jgi:SAM-dependent methyltransferase
MTAAFVRLLYLVRARLSGYLGGILFYCFWRCYWWRERRLELAHAPDPPIEPIYDSERALLIQEIIGFKNPGRILEAGFGYGQNISILKSLLPKSPYVGIEIDFERVHAVRSLYPSDPGLLIDLFNADMCHLPFPDNAFDTVFVAAVLLYIPDNRIADAVSELYRVSGDRLVFLEQHIETAGTQKVSYPGSSRSYYLRNYEMLFHHAIPHAGVRSVSIPNKRWVSEQWKEYGRIFILHKD